MVAWKAAKLTILYSLKMPTFQYQWKPYNIYETVMTEEIEKSQPWLGWGVSWYDAIANNGAIPRTWGHEDDVNSAPRQSAGYIQVYAKGKGALQTGHLKRDTAGCLLIRDIRFQLVVRKPESCPCWKLSTLGLDVTKADRQLLFR
jgi:hypothetical protein